MATNENVLNNNGVTDTGNNGAGGDWFDRLLGAAATGVGLWGQVEAIKDGNYTQGTTGAPAPTASASGISTNAILIGLTVAAVGLLAWKGL